MISKDVKWVLKRGIPMKQFFEYPQNRILTGYKWDMIEQNPVYTFLSFPLYTYNASFCRVYKSWIKTLRLLIILLPKVAEVSSLPEILLHYVNGHRQTMEHLLQLVLGCQVVNTLICPHRKNMSGISWLSLCQVVWALST